MVVSKKAQINSPVNGTHIPIGALRGHHLLSNVFFHLVSPNPPKEIIQRHSAALEAVAIIGVRPFTKAVGISQCRTTKSCPPKFGFFQIQPKPRLERLVRIRGIYERVGGRYRAIAGGVGRPY
jgi:hypothetical protein